MLIKASQIFAIYKIKNIVDNKIYIGQTTDLKERWVEHRRKLRKNKHRCSHLQNAWNSYGEDKFKIETIETINPELKTIDEIKILLEKREEYWMIQLKCGDHDYCYNSLTPMKSSFGSCCKIKSKKRKAVLQYSLEGNFIKEWESMTLAAKELNISNNIICTCCQEKVKQASGFMWKYKEENIILKINPFDDTYKSILQYDKFGNFIKEWETLREAHNQFETKNVYMGHILKTCRGVQKTAFNYQWKFKETETSLKINSIYKIREKKKYKQVYKSKKINGIHKGRMIDQFDMNGNFIKRWDRIVDAERALNISSLNGYSDHCGGFKWKYVNPKPKDIKVSVISFCILGKI